MFGWEPSSRQKREKFLADVLSKNSEFIGARTVNSLEFTTPGGYFKEAAHICEQIHKEEV